MKFHCFHYISHFCRNLLVYCVIPHFGMKRIMNAILRYVLERMDIGATYVERYTVQRRPYVYTGRKSIQMMYVIL